jgi:hypothetical protein
MEFMLMFNSPASDLERSAEDPESRDYWESWRLYMKDVYSAGIVKSGNALASPFSGTTIRMREGKRQVQDGPFADTKELLGGYLIIEVPSIDEAMSWATKSPSSASGSTEIRPIADVRKVVG